MPSGTGGRRQWGGVSESSTGEATWVISPKGDETDVYSGTITLGAALTENLTARLEYRRDDFDTDGSSFMVGFPKGSSNFKDTSDYAVFEVSYVFD